MMRPSRTFAVLVVAVALSCGIVGFAARQASAVPPSDQTKAPMTTRAHGSFDVKLTPQPADDAALGRMMLDKQFHGDLEATGKGQMLTAGTNRDDSGVYVAVERISGTLGGRTGTFIVHHTGVMTRGAQQLTIRVVPDSGTGELSGISGLMSIDIREGKHFYNFDYTLNGTP